MCEETKNGQIDHALQKLIEIGASFLAKKKVPEGKSLFQLGYNAGRLAEMAGLGREGVWDRLRDPVDQGDWLIFLSVVRGIATRLEREVSGNIFDKVEILRE